MLQQAISLCYNRLKVYVTTADHSKPALLCSGCVSPFHPSTLPLCLCFLCGEKQKRRYSERRYILGATASAGTFFLSALRRAPVHGSGTKDAITAHPIRNDSVMTAQCKQERDHYENSFSKHAILPKCSKALRSRKKQSLD